MLLARLKRGLGAHGFLQLSLLMIRVFEIPLFIHFWGAQRYGEWLMLTAIPTALSLSDAGFTKTANREMAIRISQDDSTGAQSIFQTTSLFIFLLAILISTIAASTLSLISITEILNLHEVIATDASITILILLVQVLITLQCTLLYGCFASTGKYATGTILLAVYFSLTFLSLITTIIFQNSFVIAACGSLIGASVGYLIMRITLKIIDTQYSYGLKKFSLEKLKILINPSLANLSFPISEFINLQGLRLLVGIVLGPTSVVIFSATRTLCRIALQPVLSISRTLEPELSMAFGKRDSVKTHSLVTKGTQLSFWMSIALAVLLIPIASFLFNIWTTGNIHLDWTLFLPILAASILSSLWSVPVTYLCAINKHIKISIEFLLAYTFFNLPIAYILTLYMGLPGMAFSIMISEALIVWIAFNRASPMLKENSKQFFMRSMKFPKNLISSLKNIRE